MGGASNEGAATGERKGGEKKKSSGSPFAAHALRTLTTGARRLDGGDRPSEGGRERACLARPSPFAARARAATIQRTGSAPWLSTRQARARQRRARLYPPSPFPVYEKRRRLTGRAHGRVRLTPPSAARFLPSPLPPPFLGRPPARRGVVVGPRRPSPAFPPAPSLPPSRPPSESHSLPPPGFGPGRGRGLRA